ncbi:MAG: hypothetical protein J6S53_04620 [Lentisphaeria bacterium]|nr:hypothetical protein [Lentisphaeria bacterium]
MSRESFERIYDVDFSFERENSYPDCFRLCCMSPHPNKLGLVRDGEFCVTFPGSWHILKTEKLSDFHLTFTMGKNLNSSRDFLIYLHCDDKTLTGAYLQIQANILTFGSLADTRYIPIEKMEDFNSDSFEWEITAQGNRYIVKNGSKEMLFTAPEDMPEKGYIAFDSTSYGANEFRIKTLALDVPGIEYTALKSFSTEMKNGPHGIPLGYTIHIQRKKISSSTLEKWQLCMAGGPGDVEKLPFMLQRFLNAESMHFPYCRGLDENKKELFRFCIANGIAGNKNVFRCTFGFPQFEFPLTKNITVNTENLAFLAFGYEFYQAETAISCAGKNGEMLCDLTGKVHCFEKVYPDGQWEVCLESHPEKAILSLIPEDIPCYEDALEFARKNHYFLEGEKISFKAFCANKKTTMAKCVLEDAFGNTIKKFRKKAEEYFFLPALAPGVYHLRAALYNHELFLGEVRHAFEVIPDDPEESAQDRSGLPEFFPDEFLSDMSEHFHPWGGAIRNVSHYTSTGNMYTFCSDRRYLKLLKVYHRKWTSRCQPRCAPDEDNAFIRENAVLIQSRNLSDNGRYYLHYPPTYENEWIKEKTKLFAGKELSFEEIYPEKWTAWLDFIAPYCREQFKSANTFRKGVKASEYLGAATYGAIYKGANYSRLTGIDLRNGKFEEIITGFAVMEDYPYSSRYPLSRSIWQYTAFCMEAPKVRFLPQVWGLNAETQDGRVVYSHPPYGRSITPPGFFFTRLTELLFDTAWFDGENFHYWDGNGALHSSSWTEEMFQVALEAFALRKKYPPARPLRTPAYVYSRAACDAHEYFYEKNEKFIRGGSMINTAEEFPAYMYEMARKDGQLGGFQTRMESLKGLCASDVSCLVLPPLKGVPDEEIKEIRRLHETGVNILCSEDAASLADLFDVENAQCLLERDGKKFLTLKKNKTAYAAFFTGAPSMQKRGRDRTGGSGQKALDEEVNMAAISLMRLIGDYPLTATDHGSVTAFTAEDGISYAFVRENAWPHKGNTITPEIYYKGKYVKSVLLEEYGSHFFPLDKKK